MSLKTWQELPIGGYILEAGSAKEYETGSWRTFKPIFNQEKCIHCLFCWVYCPDDAVNIKDSKMIGFDYLHCKGCGICAFECPDKAKAIEMVLEHQTE
jgi:2-oxoacid:acceptor oxidoreductase delta subunit (pyruvate/2-ketoisovalerate family)